MIEALKAVFSYDFLTRALIVGVLVSLCCSLLGVSLVLKRYSMIGDGLSHVAFGAMAVALALDFAPLYVAIPVVIIAAFFLLKLSENSKVKGDSAIAIISSSALAIGVIVISVSKGMNTDVYNFMFGSILSMSRGDVITSVALSAVVILLFVFCYNKIFAITFDENFARATGIKADAYNMLLAFLTAVTIVIGMRMIGSLLISSLIIFPALTAMRVAKSYKGVVITSAIVSVAAFSFGLWLSYPLSTPAGASVVVVNLIFFVIFSVIGKIKYKA